MPKPPTPGRIVQFCRASGKWRPFHVTDCDDAGRVTGWVLLSPSDVGCDEHGVIPPGTPQSPWRAYRKIPEGDGPGRWRWPPRV